MDDETPTWPDSEARYRLRPPAGTGLDVFAAVLDATPRDPTTVALRLGIGRQAELLGPRRIALEGLSGHTAVSVAEDHTAGTVPLSGGAFEDIAGLFGAIDRAVVRDAGGTAIVQWDGEEFQFALSDAAIERLRGGLDTAVAARLDPAD